VLRASTFEAMEKLMQSDGASDKFVALQRVYTLVTPDSAEAMALAKAWPLAQTEPVMSLNTDDKAAMDAARLVFLEEYPKLVIVAQFPFPPAKA